MRPNLGISEKKRVHYYRTTRLYSSSSKPTPVFIINYCALKVSLILVLVYTSRMRIFGTLHIAPCTSRFRRHSTRGHPNSL